MSYTQKTMLEIMVLFVIGFVTSYKGVSNQTNIVSCIKMSCGNASEHSCGFCGIVKVDLSRSILMGHADKPISVSNFLVTFKTLDVSKCIEMHLLYV